MQISFCVDLQEEILQKFLRKIKITNRGQVLITIVTASVYFYSFALLSNDM